MKNAMNPTLLAVGLALLAVVNLQAGSPAATLTQVWRFGANANPAAPDTASGLIGVSRATVTPGTYSSGWANNLLGDAQGIWDLGHAGRITLGNNEGLVGPATQTREFTVRVVEYYDGMIYNEATTVTVPGATQLSSTETTVKSAGNLGDWVARETRWQAPAGEAVTTIEIGGASGDRKGSVIDEVSVQSWFAGGASIAQLNIRKTDSGVELTWSADYAGMVLETAESVGGAGAWAAVDQTPVLAGDKYSVTLNATGGAKFYRLKQQ